MSIQPLHQTLLPWLPRDYQAAMKELMYRVHNSVGKAGDLVLLNPAARGTTQAEMLDWIPAMICLTFMQHFEDGKLEAIDGTDKEILSGLYSAADSVVTKFVAQYKGERHVKLSTTNFINSFLSLSEKRLTDIHPNTLSFSFERSPKDDVQLINFTFEKSDWRTIKEFSPDAFDLSLKNTAKARYWKKRRNLKIIPIDVLQDVLMINLLLEQMEEAGKDLNKAVDQKMPVEAIYDRESIYLGIQSQILMRILNYYTDYYGETELESYRLIVREIIDRFAKVPADLIESLGPEILCVPWRDNIA